MDEQQKNEFAARLQRIQAQKAEDEATLPAETGEMPSPRPKMDGPAVPQRDSGIGIFRIGMIAVTALAFLGFGALFLLGLSGEPEDIAAAPPAPPNASTDATDAAPPDPLLAFVVPREEQTATSGRVATDRGWEYRLGSVATPDGAQVQVVDIASGFDPNQPDRIPDRVEVFAHNTTCTLRRPQAGEVVRNVRIGLATAETDLHAVSDAAISHAVLSHTKAALFKPKSHEVGLTAKGRFNRIDVFVTDTSAPVYLVLQSLWGNTLWNVHRGQGVKIAHIAMIGNSSGIVAPEGVAFEALRIADFVTNFEFEANDTVRPCMIAPYRLPKPYWEGQQKAAKGNDLFENQMFTFNSGHRAFSAWYTETLGADPELGLTEAEGAAHALVGPVPPDLLGYRTLAGRTVHVTEADNLLIGDDTLAEAHRAMMLAAAGGEVANILPPARRIGE